MVPPSCRPSAILEDLDTAVVDLWGSIPAGRRRERGSTCSSPVPPETQTRSLDGGVMFLPAEMYLAVPGELAGKQSKVYAQGRWDESSSIRSWTPAQSEDLPKFREGRIIGGGKVLEDRPVRLRLFQPNYQKADLIQRRLNERFGPGRIGRRPGQLHDRDPSFPPSTTREYERFFRLLMHLPIRQAGRKLGDQGQGDRLGDGVLRGQSRRSWRWCGRRSVGRCCRRCRGSTIRPIRLWRSTRPAPACGWATPAPCPWWRRVAAAKGSPLQMAAIEELGRQSLSARVTPVAARTCWMTRTNPSAWPPTRPCSARGTPIKIKRIAIKEQFDLDLVDSTGKPMIYVSQSLRPRIVLFGQDVLIRRPMFFKAPEDLVTLSATEGQRSSPSSARFPAPAAPARRSRSTRSSASWCACWARCPSQEPGQEVYGLGLTYGQVVSVLYRLCKTGDIPAGFRLQVLPEIRRIYTTSAAPLGRPDMPGHPDGGLAVPRMAELYLFSQR